MNIWNCAWQNRGARVSMCGNLGLGHISRSKRARRCIWLLDVCEGGVSSELVQELHEERADLCGQNHSWLDEEEKKVWCCAQLSFSLLFGGLMGNKVSRWPCLGKCVLARCIWATNHLADHWHTGRPPGEGVLHSHLGVRQPNSPPGTHHCWW